MASREDTGTKKLDYIPKKQTRVNEINGTQMMQAHAIFLVTRFTRYMELKVFKLGEFYNKH